MPERHPQAHASPRLKLTRRPSSSSVVAREEEEEAQTTCVCKTHGSLPVQWERSPASKDWTFGVARWSASQTLSEHVFEQSCGREMCDTRLAFLMHAQRPGPTHVRILNDLPVDCTSVSLTASVCVSPHTRTRLSSKTTKRLSRANRMPEPLHCHYCTDNHSCINHRHPRANQVAPPRAACRSRLC